MRLKEQILIYRTCRHNLVADKRKPTVGSTVAPPSEKADFLSQLQNTFERGVVSAEVDIGGLLNQQQGAGGSVKTLFGEAVRTTTGPQGVSDSLISKMKNIASVYNGQFRTHAPMQANPAGLTEIGRTQAALLLKKSLDYTTKLDGKHMTVHPIGQMSYYFVEPFVGMPFQVSNPFMLSKNKEELTNLMNEFGVKDPVLKDQIESEWRNFVRVLPLNFAEKYGAVAIQEVQKFKGELGACRAGKLMEKYENNPEGLLKRTQELEHKLDPQVFQAMMNNLDSAKNPSDKKQLIDMIDFHKERANEGWKKAALAMLDPMTRDGEIVSASNELRKLYNKKNKSGSEENRLNQLLKEHRDKIDKIRFDAWGSVMESGRFGPFKDSQETTMKHVVDTFDRIFKGIVQEKGATYKRLKAKKMTIGLENLFPMVPEKGYMQGFAHFYKPEHMIELIKKVKAKAKVNGLPEDVVTITFDIGHAAASGIKPSDFLKKLKKGGIDPKYIHLVGGPGYGHGHIAWGDWLDEVSKMDPGILTKLMDVGAINIEGGQGLYDTEVTLNTMWNDGLPMEAMMAMAGGPENFSPQFIDRAGYASRPNEQMARGYFGTQMPVRSFYSFQNETSLQPMKGAFGSYSMPGRYAGGYTIGPSRTSNVWASSQPLLYSSKRGKD